MNGFKITTPDNQEIKFQDLDRQCPSTGYYSGECIHIYRTW